jgi:hypothetical protein
MKAVAIVRAAYASGVDLAVTATGSIKAKGSAAAVAKRTLALAANKPAIVEELSRLGPVHVSNTTPGCLAHGPSPSPDCFAAIRLPATQPKDGNAQSTPH